MRRHLYQLIFTVAILMLANCSSGGYGSGNRIQHSYTTDTQRPGHSITGVEISYDPPPGYAFLGVFGQTVLLTKLDLTIYINQEEIGSFNASSSYKTFIKLPPGEHEFAYKMSKQGFMTLGVKTTPSFYVYRFNISKGKTGEIALQTTFKASGKRELDINLENINSFNLVAECSNDNVTCDPK